MKDMSATEAAHRFSMVLDEAGDRDHPWWAARSDDRSAPRANGRAVAEVLNSWHRRLGGHDEFEANVSAAQAAAADLDGDPWRE